MDINSNKPGYTALTKEEMVQAVSRPDEEDNELIADERAVPSHGEAYVCLLICIWCLQVQVDCDPGSM